MQTATQARALAHYTQLASQAACWASQAANEAAAAADAADDDDAALESVADDAADELLTEAGELMLYMAEDDKPTGTRYYKAWNGTQLREGLTCDEIVEACIWAPAGADLRHAMYVLREKLRAIAHDKHAAEVTKIARRMLAEECDE